MAEFRPIKKGTSTPFAEMGGTDTIPASLIGIVPKFEVPTGAVNGSNTVFTLSATPVANASVIMVLDGVTQTNGTDYTVSGTTVTFTTAPTTGTEVVAIYNSAASAGGGDFSSNTSSSVDGEVVLFSGTGGKTGKRATGTGLAKLTSGVVSALTSAQATTELNAFVGDSGAGGTKGLVPAPATGDSGKYLKGDGTWTAVAGGGASVITPSQITSDQDNYAPTGWATATHVRISGNNGIRAITSFSASSISDGHEKTLINVGSYPIYFPGEHPDGTATNRIKASDDFIVFPGELVKIIYDTTISRWVLSPKVFGIIIGCKMLYYFRTPGSTTAGDYGDMVMTAIGTGTITGTAATTALPGHWLLSTASSATAGYYLGFPKTGVRFSAFASAHICVFALISFPVLSDGTDTFFTEIQITNTPNTSTQTPNNTVGIRYSHGTNSGKFQGFSKDNAAAESTVDTGITVATDTLYQLCVVIDKSKTEVRYYIDGVMVGRVTGNLPDSVVIGTRIMHVKTVGTTARTLRVHSIGSYAIYP